MQIVKVNHYKEYREALNWLQKNGVYVCSYSLVSIVKHVAIVCRTDILLFIINDFCVEDFDTHLSQGFVHNQVRRGIFLGTYFMQGP